MDKYKIPVSPLKGIHSFESIETGEVFTVPGTFGFGDVFVGFPVYVKTNDAYARDFIGGDLRHFKPDAEIVKLKIGSMERSNDSDNRQSVIND